MDQDSNRETDTNAAAHAFGELRAEISLLRRAVERLTDERTSQPDYAPSLEAIGKRLEDVGLWAKRVSNTPALQLTPEAMEREIGVAAAKVRAQDHEQLQRAARDMAEARRRIDAMIARSRSAAEQGRELLHNRIAFAVAGVIVFAIVPGAVARALPASWAVPERIAARVLGTDMWRGGQRMMGKADPERWDKIVKREHTQTAPRKQSGCPIAFGAAHRFPEH